MSGKCPSVMSMFLPFKVVRTSHDLDPEGWTLSVSPFSMAIE